jgi:hypothetical protein
MPFNGSGTFTLVAGNPVVTGTVISSTVQNNTSNDFATGFTNCVTRDGQSAALSNLPMGGYKHTGAGAASATGEYLTYGQTSASLSSATIGTLSVTGNASINGNTTIGDAGSDTLTVNAATTISGTTALNGAVTLGDAAGDAIAVAGTLTVTSQAAFANSLTVGNADAVGDTVFDWYRRGVSFTPGLTFGGLSTGITYNINRGGAYTRIGNTVYFRLLLILSNKGSATGTASITGLPFASASTGVDQAVVSISATGMTGLAGAMVGAITSGSSSVSLVQWGGTGTASVTDASFTNNSSVYVTGFYHVS